MAKDITKLFNQFAGQEVRVEEEYISMGSEGGDGVYLFPDRNDPTYKAMEKTAKDNGYQDFFLLGADWEGKELPPYLKRNNVVCGYIEKVAEEKWRVKNTFVVG